MEQECGSSHSIGHWCVHLRRAGLFAEVLSMRRIAWGLLLLFAFAIPWEYSLDLGEPLGNAARMAGLLLIVAAIPAVLQAGRVRAPGPMQWVVLTFYLWFCCSYFWTIEP